MFPFECGITSNNATLRNFSWATFCKREQIILTKLSCFLIEENCNLVTWVSNAIYLLNRKLIFYHLEKISLNGFYLISVPWLDPGTVLKGLCNNGEGLGVVEGKSCSDGSWGLLVVPWGWMLTGGGGTSKSSIMLAVLPGLTPTSLLPDEVPGFCSLPPKSINVTLLSEKDAIRFVFLIP